MADEVAQVSMGFSALPDCGIRTIDSLRPCSLKLSFHPWYIFGTVIFVCHDISFCDLGKRDASKWHVPFTCSVVSACFTLLTELPRLADQQILLAVPLHEPDPPAGAAGLQHQFQQQQQQQHQQADLQDLLNAQRLLLEQQQE